MRYTAARLVFLVAMLMAVRPVDAAISGKYSDGQLTVEITESAGACTGSFTMGNQQFPVVAKSKDNALDGAFQSGNNSFPFKATLDTDTLTLTTGSKTYTLKRVSAAVNPLGASAPAPANPLAPTAAAPAGSDPLSEYTVVATTDMGKSLVTQKPAAATVRAALEATFPDLANYFGARPKIGRAYEDVKDHKSGGATFTSTFNGKEVRGIVSCRLNEKAGATVAVVYGRSDASKAEWDKLTTPPAPPSGDPNAAVPAADDSTKALGENAKVYQFPDGTGTITLPDGWKTQSQSALDPTLVTGPADQKVVLNNSYTIETPDSPNQQMVARNQAMMRQMGGNPPPPPFSLVAEFTDPVQAMTDLAPQLSQLSQSRGGPATHLDKILSHKDLPSPREGVKSAVVGWLVTRTQNGNSAQYHGVQLVNMAMVGQGVWTFTATAYTAPVATFAQDKPVMEAIVNSLNINQDVVTQKLGERNQQQMAMIKQSGDAAAAAQQSRYEQFQKDQNQRFATGQAQHAAQMQGYDQHNKQWAADELQKSRSNADFIETIKGTRTIYDTQTGQSGTANLTSVNGVVDELNQASLDPNRFVQIPLRDEMYPLPAGSGK